MEKRLFGVILTVLGIAGLIIAAYNFVQGNTGTNHSVKSVAGLWYSGVVFLFCGYWSDQKHPGSIKPQLINSIMEKFIKLNSSWDDVKEKIKETNPEITDSDLELDHGNEEELFENLSKKLHKSEDEVKAWIESVSGD